MSVTILRWKIFPAILLAITSVLLIASRSPLGWLAAMALVGASFFQARAYRRQLLATLASVILLAILPIKADMQPVNLLLGITALSLAVAIPYVVTRHFKDDTIRFIFHHGRRWHLYEILYVFVPFTLGYLSLPYYFLSTQQYLHWSVTDTPIGLITLLLSLVAVGIWDELFFVATVLGVFQKQMSFWVANSLQAVIFASFLYALGFGGWGFLVCYVFALIQGYIYKKTGSLLYAITVHVVFDVVLFLALIYAHHPDKLPIFFIH